MAAKDDILSFKRTPNPITLPAPDGDQVAFNRAVHALLVRLASGALADRAVLWRDLNNAELIQIRDGGGVVPPGTTPGPVQPAPGTTPIPDVPPSTPTGLIATAGVLKVLLSWDEPDRTVTAYTEIHRASVDDIGQAVMVGASVASVAPDTLPAAGASAYYWIRHVGYSSDGAEPLKSGFNAVAGTPATVGKIGTLDLGLAIVLAQNLANGSVTFDKLFSLPESLCPDPLFRDVAWWTGNTYTTPGWYFEDAATGNTPDLMGVARAATLWSGGGNNGGAFTAATPAYAWSKFVPFSGVGQVVRLRARCRNASNQTGGVTLRCSDRNFNTVQDFPLTFAAGSGITTNSVQAIIPSGTAYISFFLRNDAGSAFNGLLSVSEVKLDTAATADMLVAGSIIAGSAVIADAAIRRAHIELAAIDEARIADAAIGTAKIADAAITNAKVNDLSADKITAGVIAAARIGAQTISTDKLTVGAQGLGAASILVNSDWTEYAGTNAGMAALPGWGAYNQAGGFTNLAVGRNWNSGNTWNHGRGGVWLFDQGPSGSGEWGIVQSVPVSAGITYEMHVKGAQLRCGGRIVANWFTAGNVLISQSSFPFQDPGTGTFGSDIQLNYLAWGSAVAPAGAAYALVYLIKNAMNAGAADSYLFANEFHFAPMPAGASASNPTLYRQQGAVEISGGGVRANTINAQSAVIAGTITGTLIQADTIETANLKAGVATVIATGTAGPSTPSTWGQLIPQSVYTFSHSTVLNVPVEAGDTILVWGLLAGSYNSGVTTDFGVTTMGVGIDVLRPGSGKTMFSANPATQTGNLKFEEESWDANRVVRYLRLMGAPYEFVCPATETLQIGVGGGMSTGGGIGSLCTAALKIRIERIRR